MAGIAENALRALRSLCLCRLYSLVQLNGFKYHSIRTEAYSHEHRSHGCVNAKPTFKFNHFKNILIALSEIAGVALAVYIIMYTKKKWLWAGLLSIAAGLFANVVWIIPTNR